MSEDWSELHEAIGRQDVVAVRLLAAAQAAGDSSDALHYAAGIGHADVIKAMLDDGWKTRINQFDDISYTPLTCAAVANHIAVVRLHLAYGAEIDALDEEHIGNTALREVAESGSVEIIRLLLEAGADPEIPGWMQLTAVDEAQERLAQNPSLDSQDILRLMKSARKPEFPRQGLKS